VHIEILVGIPNAEANATSGNHGIRFEVFALPSSSSAAQEEGPSENLRDTSAMNPADSLA